MAETQDGDAQATVEYVDESETAQPDTDDQSLQATPETAHGETLTDVSATTGHLSADAQTDVSAFNLVDTGLQHGAAYSSYADAHNEADDVVSTAEVEAEAMYDLTDFAQENDSKILVIFSHTNTRHELKLLLTSILYTWMFAEIWQKFS